MTSKDGNMSKAERIKAVLVEFEGYGLTAAQIADEAGASLSWTYEVLRRLREEGFLEQSNRDPRGIPSRARHYCVNRGALEVTAEDRAEELAAWDDVVDAYDFDAEFAAWQAA
jgi:transposase